MTWYGRKGGAPLDARRPPTAEEWDQAPDARLLAGGEALEVEELERRAAELFATLPVREREVAELRWGLGGAEPLPRRTVGDLLNLTPREVRSLEARALARLRDALDGG